jgi:hypothetical protein
MEISLEMDRHETDLHGKDLHETVPLQLTGGKTHPMI